MSLSSYMEQHLEGLQAQWSRALHTLSAAELEVQREALRAQCEGRSGVSPAAMVLGLLDTEIARREAGK